jgi:hypothetical protein
MLYVFTVILSKNSLCLEALVDFIPFCQLYIGLHTFPTVSYARSVIGVCVNGALFSNLLLDFRHVLSLYHVYRRCFYFTPYHYDGFMTWPYDHFMLFYNDILMTCPYLPVIVISALFILSAVLSCGMVQLILYS